MPHCSQEEFQWIRMMEGSSASPPAPPPSYNPAENEDVTASGPVRWVNGREIASDAELQRKMVPICRPQDSEDGLPWYIARVPYFVSVVFLFLLLLFNASILRVQGGLRKHSRPSLEGTRLTNEHYLFYRTREVPARPGRTLWPQTRSTTCSGPRCRGLDRRTGESDLGACLGEVH